LPFKKGSKIPGAAKTRIVKASEIAGLFFETDKGRKSEYAQALMDLVQSPEGTVLEVEKVTARPSLAGRARKMGISILFGEANGKLYIKAIGARTPEGLIIELLADGPKTMSELAKVIEPRFPDCKLQPALSQLASSSQIQLRDKPGTRDKVWFLVAGKLAAA
jgi:hypothetical protein